MAWRSRTAGVEEQGMFTQGFPRNLGGPLRSSEAGEQVSDPPVPNGPGLMLRYLVVSGANRQILKGYGLANINSRSDGEAEVGVAHSTDEDGELTRRAHWREGATFHQNRVRET